MKRLIVAKFVFFIKTKISNLKAKNRSKTNSEIFSKILSINKFSYHEFLVKFKAIRASSTIFTNSNLALYASFSRNGRRWLTDFLCIQSTSYFIDGLLKISIFSKFLEFFDDSLFSKIPISYGWHNQGFDKVSPKNFYKNQSKKFSMSPLKCERVKQMRVFHDNLQYD